jgi:hypothetical protein
MISKSSLNVERSLSIAVTTITKEHLYRFCVRSLADLKDKIIPFFRENQLRTAKREDFEKFARVLELIGERKHLELRRHHGDCENRTDDESQETIQILRILRDYTPGIFKEMKI